MVFSPLLKVVSPSTHLGHTFCQSKQDPAVRGSWLWQTTPVPSKASSVVAPLEDNQSSSADQLLMPDPLAVFCRKKRLLNQPHDDAGADIIAGKPAIFGISEGNKLLDLCASDAKLSLASIGSPVKLKPKVEDPVAVLKRSSLMQELAEFCMQSESKITTFPDYFSESEKQLVKQVAERLHLGCQIGERNVAVYTLGSSEKSSPLPLLVARHKNNNELHHHAVSSHHTPEEVYVDVSELAQQGKDGFIARLRLGRLSSGSGLRRNMLWDVAQLSSSTDGVADPVNDGDGGVYAVQSRSSGEKLAMFKPTEEEKFVREGLFPGEGAVREEAAYVLDSRCNGFSGVPATAVARLQLASSSRAKQGALQRFMMSSSGSMDGFGMPFDLAKAEAFVPVDQVHRIALLDVRLFNTDRHPGNILLIGDKPPYTMIPIDHGCILPSWFHLSEARFDWLEYPQCKVPLSATALEYIDSLDADADALVLRSLGIREECVTTLKICTLFLKRAARAGKTLFWMGSFMQRSGCFENPSQLELVIHRACEATAIPFSFVTNEFREQKGSIPLGVLSRRPPPAFYDALDQELKTALHTE